MCYLWSKLQKAEIHVCSWLWKNNRILHHDNASCHTSLILQHFFAKNQIRAITGTTFSRSYSIWLLALPKTKAGAQMSLFCILGGNLTDYTGKSKNHKWRGLPKVLPAMAGTMEDVGMCRRAVLQGWLG